MRYRASAKSTVGKACNYSRPIFPGDNNVPRENAAGISPNPTGRSFYSYYRSFSVKVGLSWARSRVRKFIAIRDDGNGGVPAAAPRRECDFVKVRTSISPRSWQKSDSPLPMVFEGERVDPWACAASDALESDITQKLSRRPKRNFFNNSLKKKK